MKNKKILYGIIGVGHLGNFHTQQALKIKTLQVVGVFDLNKQRGQEIASKYNVSFYTSLNKLLKKCDAVSIVTPAKTHFKIALQAISKNCHVFIEKPFATNLNDAKQLVQLAKKKKKIIQIGHIEQFNPVFNEFLNYIPKPLFIESERLSPFNKRGIDVDVILDLMIHDIDLILSLVNSKIKRIDANGIKILSSAHDLVNARLLFNNGTTANLTASRLSTKPMRKLRVFESSTYSSLDLQNLSLTRYISSKKTDDNKNIIFDFNNKAVSKEEILIAPKNALYEELSSFSNSILNKQVARVDGKQGIKTLNIAFLIQKKINETQ